MISRTSLRVLLAAVVALILPLVFIAPAQASNESDVPQSGTSGVELADQEVAGGEAIDDPEPITADSPSPTDDEPVRAAETNERAAIAVASAPTGTPTIRVSKTEVSPSGSTTVTVTGRNFDPSLGRGSRPPLPGQLSGLYVTFGKFAADWRPSDGAASSTRVGDSARQKWAVPAATIEWTKSSFYWNDSTRAQLVELESDGSFTAELTINKAELDALVANADNPESLTNYGIYTYAGSGAVVKSYETHTPITFAGPSVTVSKTELPSSGTTTVTVTGRNFDASLARGSRPPLAGQLSGLYVTFGKFAADWRPSDGAASTARIGDSAGQKWAVPAQTIEWTKSSVMWDDSARAQLVELGADGSFTAELTVDKALLDRLVAQADNPESLVNYGIYTYAGSGAVVKSYETRTPLTFTGNGTGPEAPGGDTKPDAKVNGALTWGVKASFRSYIRNLGADGSIATSRGAAIRGGVFRFFQKSTSAEADGTGATRYGGTVRFTGHGGALNVAISDPIITVESRSKGSLSVVTGGRRITMGTLNLAAASKRTSGGAITFAGAPARLTAAGAAVFKASGPGAPSGAFYQAGDALDPVTFTIGSNGGAASGTSSIASADLPFKPPAAPPATTGAELQTDSDDIKAGDIVSVSADGFGPNETGIAVVVYSKPVVLAQDVKADAQGNVTWSGPLPGHLEAGEHTLTFQGESISRGVKFTIAGDDNEIGRCEIDDARLDWGVKEAWRAYMSGSIAEGDWTTGGNASYKTPTFTFVAGEGDLDAEQIGDVRFSGWIDFEGHHGALKVKLDDPVVRLVDKDKALLVVDVTAGDRNAAMSGDASTTTTKAVPFADIDLAKANVKRSKDGSSLTITDAPAILTEQGHQVFSTYQAGDELDPINLAVTTDGDCGDAISATKATPVPDKTVDDGGSTSWWLIGGAAVLAALTFGGGLWLGRRRATP